MSIRGFTLLEVLAVVVLLSLATAATVVGIAGIGDAGKIRFVTAVALDLDGRARMAAGTGAQIDLMVEETRLVLVGHDDDEPLAEVSLPEGVSVRLLIAADEPLRELAFDRSGCTPDYRIVVSSRDRSQTIAIAGLTGWSEGPAGEPQ